MPWPAGYGGDLSRRATHAPERLIDGIFAERPARRMKRRKQETIRPRQRMQLDKVEQYLRGQGNGVRPPHLHPLSGDFPDPVFQIELGPQRLSEFAGTGHDMGHNLHGEARDQMARICVDRSQQLPERLRIKDRAVVLNCGFRGEAGRHSDLIPAGIPTRSRPPFR